MNGTDSKQEVSLEFPFAYPDADSTGQIHMVYDNQAMASKYSIADGVKGFPRNFILEPGKRQAIRLTVKPGKQYKDGMYWTRIKTISNPESPPVGPAEGNNINPQITFKFEQVTTLFYKVGKLNTGLTIQGIKVDLNGEKSAVITEVNVEGNSPYLGTMNLDIKDASGKSVLTQRVFVSIYMNDTRRIEFNGSGLKSGEYTAELSFTTERGDIPQKDIVQAPPVSQNVRFSVQ